MTLGQYESKTEPICKSSEYMKKNYISVIQSVKRQQHLV